MTVHRRPVIAERPIQTSPVVACDPWRVLVVCLCLNRATGDVAARVLPRVFERWPDAGAMSRADGRSMWPVLRPLGFCRRRWRLLRAMSGVYLAGGWDDVTELPGVGAYARDAWAIFVEGRRDVEPGDRVLRAYLEAETCES